MGLLIAHYLVHILGSSNLRQFLLFLLLCQEVRPGSYSDLIVERCPHFLRRAHSFICLCWSGEGRAEEEPSTFVFAAEGCHGPLFVHVCMRLLPVRGAMLIRLGALGGLRVLEKSRRLLSSSLSQNVLAMTGEARLHTGVSGSLYERNRLCSTTSYLMIRLVSRPCFCFELFVDLC